MGAKTEIAWTDSTWNPIRGCTPVSAGCKNCYAARDAKRWSGPKQPFEGLVRINAAGERTAEWNGSIRFVEKHLLDPLKWRPVVEHTEECEAWYTGARARFKRRCNCPTRARRIFVNSVSDLFHENVTDEMRDSIFAVKALTPQHIYQALTKRPGRALEYFANDMHGMRWLDAWDKIPSIPREACASVTTVIDGVLPNVWLGVSVENQAAADERREPMRKLAEMGWLTWVSSEPRLGPIDWTGWEFIKQLVTGGESGGADVRAMSVAWPRSDLAWCRANDVRFFFKQWGQWAPTNDPKLARERGIVPLEKCMSWHARKQDAGCLLDGVEYKEFPEVRR